jgi:hypothetical protein
MIKSKVFKPVPRSGVDKKDLIDSTWSIKKKSDGTYRARMVARGFKQIDGIHYHEDNKSARVVNDITIRIVFILAVLAKWYNKGAFLHGEFEDGEKIYMEIPKCFERFFASKLMLLLLTMIYGFKQAALAFWRKLVLMMKANSLNRSKKPIRVSIIDDMNLAGKKPAVLEIKKGITHLWDCDEVGEQEESDLTREEQRTYRSGVVKLMHLARWTQVESANAIRELTKFVGAASKTHVAAL